MRSEMALLRDLRAEVSHIRESMQQPQYTPQRHQSQPQYTPPQHQPQPQYTPQRHQPQPQYTPPQHQPQPQYTPQRHQAQPQYTPQRHQSQPQYTSQQHPTARGPNGPPVQQFPGQQTEEYWPPPGPGQRGGTAQYQQRFAPQRSFPPPNHGWMKRCFGCQQRGTEDYCTHCFRCGSSEH
ncbi:hypothetical protein NHX12_004762 [Muraenolepis orangiensis]|uniref:Uncharacterized protein n=1 Tax=Muraenolepis orangiensis TaxID=630683 RepID=A0A9Q0DTD0_9TELE|nr:hypothetical protein NHX12_004762 [Muraenolepis orangiensis]